MILLVTEEKLYINSLRAEFQCEGDEIGESEVKELINRLTDSLKEIRENRQRREKKESQDKAFQLVMKRESSNNYVLYSQMEEDDTEPVEGVDLDKVFAKVSNKDIFMDIRESERERDEQSYEAERNIFYHS